MKDLIKKFGQGAFITGDQLQNYTHQVIHVSPKLDLILGDGIPGGSVVTLAGPPKCGKTVTALYIGAKGQAQGRSLHFVNVEGRIKPRDLNGIKGLDQSKMQIIRSYRDEGGQSRILTAEENLEIVEYIAHNIPGAIIIIDSVSQLATSGELTNDLGERAYAPGAALMAQLTKRLCNVIPVNDIVLIGILHVTANFARFGAQTSVTGGNKIKFAADIGLYCKKFSFLREGSSDDEDGPGKPYGQKVTWVTTSTAFAPPGQTTESIIKYGVGIDELTELVQLGIEMGFITKGGSWYKLNYLKDVLPENYPDDKSLNVQGETKLVERLSNNPEEYKALEYSMRAMLS